MTKPIRLLGWKQMKQVVANTSRLNFEISLRLLVCLCLTSRFNRNPPTPLQRCKIIKIWMQDPETKMPQTDRQTQKPTNEHRHLVFTFVNYFFLSLFLLYFSFFLSFFFLSSFSIFLSYFITLFLFAFFLSCFLSFCLFKLFLFFLFAPPHNLNHSFYLFNFFSLILSRSSTFPCLVISLFAFSLLFLLFIYLIFTLFFLCHSLSLSLSLNQSIDQPIYPSIYLPLSFSFSFSSSFHFTFLSLSQFLSFFLSFFLHF